MLSIIRGGAQSGRGWKLLTSKDHDLQTLHLNLVYYLFKKIRKATKENQNVEALGHIL